MGLGDLFEWVVEIVEDWFGDAPDNAPRRRKASEPQPANSGSALSAGEAGVKLDPNFHEVFWERLARLFDHAYLEKLSRDSGLGMMKLSFALQKQYPLIVQEWQKKGRVPTEAEWKAIQETVRANILRGG